ncbi:MAG: DegT/DnrJ/EryC1/StrS aminotransferase family protein [Hyphomicrobiales bacterium]|nr:DegT/DnrJ/EryC1/StrS aminotransferase family protein [Hyphomicrobiales bacterium]
MCPLPVPKQQTAYEPEPWPYFGDDEIEAVAEVLRSGQVNQWTGNRVKRFEAAAAERFAMPHAVAVANGTVSLELALRALGIGPGDEVVVTCRSFMASASCVSLVGATPVFADVDRDSQNLTPATVAPLLSERTRAIIPVHLAGWPADMDGLMALAEANDLLVIEDCAQAVGATVGDRPAGSFGHAASISFCQDKIITTGGEGGMVLFRDPAAWQRAWEYKDHGKSWDALQQPADGPGFRWLHGSIGTNWRLTEMQAAIGLVQLAKLDRWLAKRRANAAVWAEILGASPALRIPLPPDGLGHAFYKLYAFLRPDALKPGTARDDVLRALIEAGIRAFSGSCPEIQREAAFADLEVAPTPVAHELGETSLMFEVHPTLDPDRLRATAAMAREVVARFEA